MKNNVNYYIINNDIMKIILILKLIFFLDCPTYLSYHVWPFKYLTAAPREIDTEAVIIAKQIHPGLSVIFHCLTQQKKNKKNLEPGNLGFKTFCIVEHLIKFSDIYL